MQNRAFHVGAVAWRGVMPEKLRTPSRASMLAAACVVLASCGTSSAPAGVGVEHSGQPSATSSPRPSAVAVPRPAHTVVVILENHPYDAVIGNSEARYINALARSGALFTASYAVTHPSEPNYLALFSGSTHGVTSDQCPTTLHAPNLAADLIAKGATFTGYSEGLPGTGSQVCVQGEYARKHAPWTDFTGLPPAVNQPFSRFAAGGFASLPDVSFVIPDLCHDMHDCPVGTGDAWLRTHLSMYAAWAQKHDSLLIVTFDEDDGSQSNHIATIFTGQQVRPGRYHTPINHYNVLRTIEEAYGLPFRGQARTHFPITSIWRHPGH
ncbi:MAG: alkaline phosphatase family protein [Nocardiopsaceae bacterium]|nr:alkaline phosphatase family protein [Nocardiopsaceae bacterium]